MLIIYRLPGTAFRLQGANPEDMIDVRLLELSGRQMKIGIDAPRHVRIARDNMKGTATPGGEGGVSGNEDIARSAHAIRRMSDGDLVAMSLRAGPAAPVDPSRNGGW